uniref:Uncharacterized protein n=1 Tax=Oryza rufipogon TaxID=4529 RepID=A0A0E0P0S8_ORYRU
MGQGDGAGLRRTVAGLLVSRRRHWMRDGSGDDPYKFKAATKWRRGVLKARRLSIGFTNPTTNPSANPTHNVGR